jgi:hypothetical protein
MYKEALATLGVEHLDDFKYLDEVSGLPKHVGIHTLHIYVCVRVCVCVCVYIYIHICVYVWLWLF